MDEIPVTGLLQEIWISSMQSTEASCAYNESFTIQLHGNSDHRRLEKAVLQVVARHDALSAAFSNDGTIMRKKIATPGALPIHDLRKSNTINNDHFLKDLVYQESSTPFDLEAGPLWRAHLIIQSDESMALLFTVHHIVCDGWSLNILVHEIGKAYDNVFTGQSTTFERPASFFDYVKDSAEARYGDQLKISTEFWKKRLEGPLPVLDLPTDYTRPPRRTYRAKCKRFLLDPLIVHQIKNKAADYGCNLFSFLLGAYTVLIYKLTGNDNIVTGIPVAGQCFYKNSNLVGHCVSMLPFRTIIDPDKTFGRFAEMIQDELIDAYDHHFLSYGDILKELRLPRDPSRIPLVNTGFTYAKMPSSGEFGFQDLTAECIVNNRLFEIFELYVTVIDSKSELELLWHFNSDLFSETAVERWIEEYQVLLRGIADNTQATLSALQVLPDTERSVLLERWNATDRQLNPDKTVISMFEQQVTLTPEAIALEFRGHSLTYKQLNDKADQITAYLQSIGASPDQPIGFCLERSFDMVISLLGILKSGAAYIPIDPSFPDDRITYILQDSQAQIFITTPEIAKRFPDLIIPIINPAEVPVIQDNKTIHTVSGSHCAYIIYTSGSTGKPKGVEIRHFSLSNFLTAMRETPGMNRNDTLLAVTTISFDIAGLELLCPLTCGARVILAEKELSSDPVHLGAFISSRKPSIMQATPATWTMLLDSGWIEAGWMKILCGGEAMTRTLADRLLSTGAEVWNMYGPTETTIWSSVWKVIPGEDAPPVGKPIANTQFYILDSRLSPVPTGASGELYISGIGLARGYCNRPELTSEKFISSPFSRHLHSGLENRMYKTGDIARWRNDGTAEVLGRSDFQVKIRGYRIETGEIESVLAHHPSVKECVVTDGNDNNKNKILIAYIVFHKGAETTFDNLRTTLRISLPEYMVPSRFVQLQSLPRLTNKKFDRSSLSLPSGEQAVNQSEIVLPSSHTEEIILSIWKEVLGSGTISVNDNFFDIGGHSLIAVQIFSRVRNVFGMEFSFQDIFSYPTISSLASRIETKTRTEVTDKITTSELTRVDRSGYLPMSQAQKRLWFLHQINPDSPAYNLVQAIRIKGNVDIVLLQRAVDNLVIRQESLQMVFRSNDGQPVISLNPETKIRIINVTGEITGYSMDVESINDYIKIEVLKPFDIEHGPLTKVFLFSISPSEFISVFLIHHIITDGWSSGVLIKDLFRLYSNELPGNSTVLSDLHFQYIDFIIYQHQEHDRKKSDAQREYWLKTLGGDLPVLQMPFDFRRPEKLSQKGSELRFVIPKNITAELSYLSQKNGVTMFMTLLSGFAVLLNRYTQQEDIIIGVPVANRQHVASEDIIGFFVNTLALRLNVDISTSFENLLRHVHQVTINAIRNQDVQFDELVRILKIHRDSRYNPVFQTMFAYQNYPVPEVKNEYISFKSEWIARGATQFDFSFFLWEDCDEIHGVIEYSIELFTHVTISQMASQYITLLSTICNDSKAPSGSYKIISPEDECRIISSWNATEKPYTQTMCIHEQISKQAQKMPYATAVVANGQSLTYKDLDEQSNILARLLQNRGVKAEVPVGICLERTTGMVVALLAVLKAGGFYVPLDPYYPSERLKLMIEDASIDTVLSDTSTSKVLPEGISNVIIIDTIDIKDLDNCPVPTLSTPDNAAYMIYTSGSTGKPKGVVIAHKSLVNFARSMVKNPGIDSHDIILAITTISFDISILELLVPLTTGAQVVVVSRDIAMDGTALSHCIQNSAITFMQATPGTWRLLLSCGWSGKSDLTLLCGGEPFPEDLLFELITKVKSVWNMYGPTETTIWSTLCKLHDTDTVISIGKPIDNTQIYILDKFLNPLPPKVPGELFIGGHGVARGYFNRPDLTDQKFIADPFSAIENAKMFATGDLARWLDNETIECFGRIDSQVKIRGHRIELGEIESTTKKIPGIFNAVATVLNLSDTDSRLLLYYVAEKNNSVSASDIRKYLQQYLPEYMVPQHLLKIDSIPLTPSGKTDRKQLPVPTFHSNEKFTPPSTNTQKDLIEIWQKVLGISRIGIDDNFFDIGGHSLIAVQIFNEIFRKFNLRLPLAALIEHSTVRDFSLYLQKHIDNRDSITDKTVTFSKTETPEYQYPALSAETLSDQPIHGLKLGYDSQGRPAWFVPEKDQLQTFISLNGDGLSVKMPCTPPPQKVLFSTPAQKELLAHACADEQATTTLNETISIHLNEQIDHTALDSAIQGLAIIHEILRSHFTANGSEIIIEPEIDLHVTRHKIEVLSGIDIRDKVAVYEREMAGKRFDPCKGPLIDVTLLDSEKKEVCIIIIGVHAAIIDRWSLYLLGHDLVRLYSSFAALTSPCILPSHGFSDYLMYRTTTAYAADYQKFLYYWHSRLGLPPLPNPVPSIFDSRSQDLLAHAQHSYTSTEELTGEQLIKIKDYACKHNVSLFSVLLAAFAVSLKNLSGSEDIITGVTFAGQLFSAMAETAGRMAKVLPMRMRVESGFDFTDLCRICHNLILNASSYTTAGIEEISKEMGLTQLKVQSLMETRLTFFNTFRDKAGSFKPLYHYQPCRDTSARLELFIMETPVSLEFTVCGSTDFTSQEWNNSFVKELIHLIVANCLSNENIFTSNPERTQPEDEDERFITGLWREIFNLQDACMKSSFYAYGGDSISAVKLLDALSAHYNIKLPMSLLSEYCTIRTLARYLRKETSTVKNEPEKDTFQTGSSFGKQAWNTVVTFRRTGTLPPFFLVSGIGGNPMIFLNLSRLLEKNRPFYALQYRGVDGILHPHTKVEDIAAEFLADMQRVQPDGPYFIGGYSFGGLVAYEMIQQLEKKGQKAGGLILIDTVIPQRLNWLQNKNIQKKMKNLLKSLILNIRNNFTQASNSSHQLQNDLTAQEVFKKRFDLVGKCNSLAGTRYKLHPVKSNIFYIKSAIPTSLHISNRKTIEFRQMNDWYNVIPSERITIRTINTNHFDLLNEPLVTETAKCITEGLLFLDQRYNVSLYGEKL